MVVKFFGDKEYFIIVPDPVVESPRSPRENNDDLSPRSSKLFKLLRLTIIF